MQAMLATRDSGALLRFAQGPNFVDLNEGEVALKAKGRYAELVALYKSRGNHTAALNILKAVAIRGWLRKILGPGNISCALCCNQQLADSYTLFEIGLVERSLLIDN